MTVMEISPILLVLLACLFVESSANDQFLKEILMGRCYEQKPYKTASCSDIVGPFMNILETFQESDHRMSAEVFREGYAGRADFSSPKDKAMAWLPYKNTTGILSAFRDGGNYWTTPESTPGGHLLNGVTFCAQTVYRDEGCSKETSHAYWSFWRAAYSEFAASVEGKLEIVLEDSHVDGTFLYDSVLKHLDASKVTGVEVWGVDCTATIAKTTISFLKDTKNIPVVCKGPDILELILSQDKTEDVETEDVEPATTESKTGAAASTSTSIASEEIQEKKHGVFGHFFFWIALAIGGYLYYKRYHYGTLTIPDYDCIKGDILCPNNDEEYGSGTKSSGTSGSC
jgi:hypothetical protein